MMSTDSVSVILTVENAQAWLAAELRALIDCLADLSSRFEIIVVDNASHDYTIEIIEEMRSRFPQIRFRRYAQSRPLEEVQQTGVAMATGQFVFTAAPGERIATEELRRLWALRVDPRLLVVRSRTTARRINPELVQRLTAWSQQVTAESTMESQTALRDISSREAAAVLGSGLQMTRRDAVEKLQPANTQLSSMEPSALAQIEVSHVSHQQLAMPKWIDARRRVPSFEQQ